MTNYDHSISSIDERNVKYNVVYDIYANGVLNVSFAYNSNLYDSIPLELSNIITLPSDFESVSWYGRGPGAVSYTHLDVYKRQHLC